MKNIIGIDFGHGETTAGFVESAAVQNHDIPMQDLRIVGDLTLIPSVICKMANGEYVLNPSPKKIADAADFGIGFKAPLVASRDYPAITERNRELFREFISRVYESITGNENNPLHRDKSGETDYVTYIACPSGWNDAQVTAYIDFCRKDCGIPVAGVVKESRAAFIAARRMVGAKQKKLGNTLVIDFGSSTVDFTFFNDNSVFKPVHKGYPYGASQVEDEVFEYMLKDNPEAAANTEIVRKLYGKKKADSMIKFELREQKENFFSTVAANFNPSIPLDDLLKDRKYRGKYIEPANVNGYTKKELRDVILKDYVKHLSDMLDDFKSLDNVPSVDTVILTGGASRMFFFKDMVIQKYGVSKDDGSLIIDLDPSLTISRGIAAFGYMNEVSKPRERSLRDAVAEWVKVELPVVLKKSLEEATGYLYCQKVEELMATYTDGKIVKDGQHSMEALVDATRELLSKWTVSGGDIARIIDTKVGENVVAAVKENLEKFAEAWGYDVGENDFVINVSVRFPNMLLTQSACNNLIECIQESLKRYIDKHHMFGWTVDSYSKDRDSQSDRAAIMEDLDKSVKTFFSDIHFSGSLDRQTEAVTASIWHTVDDFIDNAKLQQYR